jgi:Kef-type K+ transport system membrane component KefB
MSITATAANAATNVHQVEDILFKVLTELIVMIAAARLMNTVFRRLGQPGAIGEIVAGLMLGPSLLGYFFPDLSIAIFGEKPPIAITIMGQIGLVLLMFQIGADFEFAHLKQSRNRLGLLLIALASVVAPFALGLGVGFLSAPILAPGIDALIYSLFCGVALAITAVPILGRILREFDLSRSPVGVVAISAAAINDVIGWVLLAAISAYASSLFTGSALGLQIAGLALLGLLALFVLRPLIDRLIAAWPIRDGVMPPNLMAIALCIMFALGIATYKLGIFAIFGGFIAGILFHRHAAFVAAWRQQAGSFTLVFFLPVFFTYTGLRTNILGLGAADIGWLCLILAASILGKIIPVYVAARASGFQHHDSLILGALMNTRALMELIVLNIGYDLGFIPQKVFTMLVIMAVVTTLMTGPLLKILLPRAGYRVPKGSEA